MVGGLAGVELVAVERLVLVVARYGDLYVYGPFSDWESARREQEAHNGGDIVLLYEPVTKS